jgi:hypothetical protein
MDNKEDNSIDYNGATENISDSFSESYNEEESLKSENKGIHLLRLADTFEDEKTNINIDKADKRNRITECFENILCSKLIISKDSNMLILKPYLIYEILFHLRNTNAINIKLETIEKLNWLVKRLHSNAFILTNSSTLKHTKMNSYFHFINELIDFLLDNNREEQITENLLTFIEKVTINSGLKIEYLKHVLQRLSLLFEKYDANQFVILLKLLNVYRKLCRKCLLHLYTMERGSLRNISSLIIITQSLELTRKFYRRRISLC